MIRSLRRRGRRRRRMSEVCACNEKVWSVTATMMCVKIQYSATAAWVKDRDESSDKTDLVLEHLERCSKTAATWVALEGTTRDETEVEFGRALQQRAVSVYTIPLELFINCWHPNPWDKMPLNHLLRPGRILQYLRGPRETTPQDDQVLQHLPRDASDHALAAGRAAGLIEYYCRDLWSCHHLKILLATATLDDDDDAGHCLLPYLLNCRSTTCEVHCPRRPRLTL